MSREVEPEEIHLFEKMCDCAEAESWKSMTMEDLIRLEVVGREVGEKDLWIRSGGKKGIKLTLRGEIKRRREMTEKAKAVIRERYGSPEL